MFSSVETHHLRAPPNRVVRAHRTPGRYPPFHLLEDELPGTQTQRTVELLGAGKGLLEVGPRRQTLPKLRVLRGRGRGGPATGVVVVGAAADTRGGGGRGTPPELARVGSFSKMNHYCYALIYFCVG